MYVLLYGVVCLFVVLVGGFVLLFPHFRNLDRLTQMNDTNETNMLKTFSFRVCLYVPPLLTVRFPLLKYLTPLCPSSRWLGGSSSSVDWVQYHCSQP